MGDKITIIGAMDKFDAIGETVVKADPNVGAVAEVSYNDPVRTLAVVNMLEAMPEGKGVDLSQALKSMAERANPNAAARIGGMDDQQVLQAVSDRLAQKGLSSLMPVLADMSVSKDELKTLMVDAGLEIRKTLPQLDLKLAEHSIREALPEADARTVQGLAALEVHLDQIANEAIGQQLEEMKASDGLKFNSPAEGSMLKQFSDGIQNDVEMHRKTLPDFSSRGVSI